MQLAAMRVDAEIENIKVIVLNDMGNSFTPLFDYEMDSVKLFFDQNNIFIKIEVTLPFQLSNYNPMSSKWEPIIERAGFMIEIF
jgi:vacuolar protein sorting-associated protein 13A/C